MSERGLRRTLDMVATVALILTCICVSAAAVQYLWANNKKPTTPNNLQRSGFNKGTLLSDVPGVDFSRFRRTVVLFVHSKCRYCTASMPFYKDLSAAALASRSQFQVVAASSESQDILSAYLGEYDVKVGNAVTIVPKALLSRVTPTVVVVDQKGVVQAVWTGQQSVAGEQEIRRELGAVGR